jgi:4-diphosphocytidyl-2-C-methyl-D-erythritol kinase
VTAPFQLRAPAKVNFRLDVLRKREDGYHDLRMIMQRIDLCDELEISFRNEPGVGLECDGADIPADSSNLVWKAAQEILKLSPLKTGLQIRLKKNIPVAAGLGGGSSDAASTLMGLNRLLKTGLADEELMAMGLRLGADVPFFIFKKPAVAEGIGEKLTPLEQIPKLWLALVNPGIHVATSWAYRNLNLTTEKVAAKLPFLYKSPEDVSEILSNDLETVTIEQNPVIAVIKELLLSAGAAGALMSGSGSTVFGIFADESAAKRALQSLPADNGWFTAVAATI